MKLTTTFIILLLLFGCSKAQEIKKNTQMNNLYTNDLIHETSPYLLQHAHNPVDWMPWNENTLAKAKSENKPLLISIGYSACHWCHVMEHESFEDTAVAKVMNEHFICIKIDREERPDIDQVYMNAVQLMTGRGGWPLNCFATPDGRPFYGGTYFPKDQWLSVLNQLAEVYQNEPNKVEEYANKLTEGVQQSDLIQKNSTSVDFELTSLNEGLEKWKLAFDPTFGGNDQAPKFPIPNNYELLLRYYYHTQDESIKKHLLLTLEKIAFGGIYDQIGGGFARYSTDVEWKVPHFEKMLYDNAQLISLYSKAYRLEKNPIYKAVVKESIQFVQEELMHKNGAFYSALDADSEGEEGKYYVWTKEELKSVLGNDFELAKRHFNINSFGLWEHGNYVLIRDLHNGKLAQKVGLTLEQYEAKVEQVKEKLKQERANRIKPGLDDKSLTSWNALMVEGLVEAYLSFKDQTYLTLAEKNAQFILTQQKQSNGALWHSYKDGKSTINGYLEDYSFTIEAFIKLYEATLNHQWLTEAKTLAEYTVAQFYDTESGMFFFTSKNDPALIARKLEISDNVIPASNSSMAKALISLGKYFEREKYLEMSEQMLKNIFPQMNTYLPGYSNWAMLLMNHSEPLYEVAIVGERAKEKVIELHQNYLPNILTLGAVNNNSHLPLLEFKYVENQTTIYVCENKVCLSPVTTTSEAIQLIQP